MDEESKNTKVTATIEAVTGLVKAIPIYQDSLQPAAIQIGQSLETLSKTVNIALAPIKLLVWGYEKIEEFINTRVTNKLKNVPIENITSPSPLVAGPAVEALRFSGHDTNLRELYANLLATAMDKSTCHKAHPGFVEILKNITSDEAVLLQVFTAELSYPLIDIKGIVTNNNQGYQLLYTNYSHLHKKVVLTQPDLLPSYINNLCRLGILDIPNGVHISDPNTYLQLEADNELDTLKNQIENEMHLKLEFDRKMIEPTAFGRQFIQSVVIEKS